MKRIFRAIGIALLSIVAVAAFLIVGGALWIELQAAIGNNPFQ